MKTTATITSKKMITPEVVVLGLKFPEPLDFKAGQFLTIRFEEDGKLRPRSYSILSPETQQEEIEICVKLVDGGLASEEFKTMEVGTSFECIAPVGNFVFHPGADQHIFIGTGTGLVPLYSMILSHMNNYQEEEFTLIFGAKTQEDLLFSELFKELEQELENFTYIPILSREAWQGKTGHVQDHLVISQDAQYYLCGQKPMVNDTLVALEEKGILSEKIFLERYS